MTQPDNSAESQGISRERSGGVLFSHAAPEADRQLSDLRYQTEPENDLFEIRLSPKPILPIPSIECMTQTTIGSPLSKSV